jgi:hypothetical protein
VGREGHHRTQTERRGVGKDLDSIGTSLKAIWPVTSPPHTRNQNIKSAFAERRASTRLAKGDFPYVTNRGDVLIFFRPDSGHKRFSEKVDFPAGAYISFWAIIRKMNRSGQMAGGENYK